MPRARQLVPQLRTRVSMKIRVIVGDSLLKGTECPVCKPDSSHKEVCCLPVHGLETFLRNSPVWFSYWITTCCWLCSLRVKRLWTEVQRHLKKTSGLWDDCLRAWEHGWCSPSHWQGPNYMTPGLLAADGVHLPQKGRSFIMGVGWPHWQCFKLEWKG